MRSGDRFVANKYCMCPTAELCWAWVGADSMATALILQPPDTTQNVSQPTFERRCNSDPASALGYMRRTPGWPCGKASSSPGMHGDSASFRITSAAINDTTTRATFLDAVTKPYRNRHLKTEESWLRSSLRRAGHGDERTFSHLSSGSCLFDQQSKRIESKQSALPPTVQLASRPVPNQLKRLRGNAHEGSALRQI